MSTTWKWIIGVIVVILVVWGLSSDGKPTLPEGSGPLKVGVILPLTGDAGVYGEAMRNVTDIAFEKINKEGGVLGRELAPVYEDGKCNGKDAVSAAQKLVNVDKVQVIVGGFCSGESLAALPIATQAKVFMISGGSSSPDLTGASDFFARVVPSDAVQGQVLAKVAYEQNNWKNIAFIQEQTDYAVGLYKSFSSTFEGLGGKINKEEFQTQTSDFRSLLSKLKASSPDALFLDTQSSTSAERIIKQLQELSWSPKILVSDAIVVDADFLKKYAKVFEGALGAEFGVDYTNQSFQSLKSAYISKFKVSDMPYPSYTSTQYDAVYIVKSGIEKVGYDGVKLAKWSRELSGWQGVSGSISIEKTGDRSSGHSPRVVKDGVSTLLK
jgi:branched-chain amino acid transport system substrate-binding protein